MVLSQVKYLPFFWTTPTDLKSCLVSVGPRTNCPALLICSCYSRCQKTLHCWIGRGSVDPLTS